MGDKKPKRYTAKYLGLKHRWHSKDFDDYEAARKWLQGRPVTSLSCNVPISASDLEKALTP